MNVGPCMNTPGSPLAIAAQIGAVASVAARLSVPPVSALPTHRRSGDTSACSQANIRARAPESGRDLVGDQEHVVLVAERAHAPEISGRVEPHAARALHDRLEDHRGELVAMRAQQRRDLADVVLAARLAEATARALGEAMDRKRAREQPVHPRDGIAHRHRAERVAVIGATQREQPLAARLSARVPVLHRELDRDLDRHRARVAQEDALEPGGSEREQPFAQGHRGLVGQAAEHHVRQPLELRAHRGLDVRMAVAVDRRPPRRHAVDELATVGEPQHGAARSLDREQRQAIGGA